jgi:hypothetical protein
MADYGVAFYSQQSAGSYRSARTILGELRAILPSACDVGCGAGTWVKALLSLVRDVKRWLHGPRGAG